MGRTCFKYFLFMCLCIDKLNFMPHEGQMIPKSFWLDMDSEMVDMIKRSIIGDKSDDIVGNNDSVENDDSVENSDSVNNYETVEIDVSVSNDDSAENMDDGKSNDSLDDCMKKCRETQKKKKKEKNENRGRRPIRIGDYLTPQDFYKVSLRLMQRAHLSTNKTGIISSATHACALSDTLYETYFATSRRIVKLKGYDIPGLNAFQALAAGKKRPFTSFGKMESCTFLLMSRTDERATRRKHDEHHEPLVYIINKTKTKTKPKVAFGRDYVGDDNYPNWLESLEDESNPSSGNIDVDKQVTKIIKEHLSLIPRSDVSIESIQAYFDRLNAKQKDTKSRKIYPHSIHGLKRTKPSKNILLVKQFRITPREQFVYNKGRNHVMK